MFRIWHKSLSAQFLPFWQIYSHKIGAKEWKRERARHNSNNNETNTAHIKFCWMNLFGIMAYLQYIWWKNSQFELVNLWQWWFDVKHCTDWTIKVYTKMCLGYIRWIAIMVAFLFHFGFWTICLWKSFMVCTEIQNNVAKECGIA